jgi:hypothetical protein
LLERTREEVKSTQLFWVGGGEKPQNSNEKETGS